MMGTTPEAKVMGDRILENYKKQLADRMAREKVTKTGGGDEKSKESENFKQKRMQMYHSNDIPDPDVLNAILSR